jgi:tetratricopeptide (TPR) repeat protein
MKRMRGVAAVLVLCFGSIGGARAEERWGEVRSPHFQVVGNAGAGAARRTAHRLESFRATLAQMFPGQPLDDVVPTVVLLFKDAGSFKPLFPIYRGKPVALGGLFINGLDRNYIALRAAAGDDAYQTVLHEYTHLLTSRMPLRLPLWMNEGLAELYSTAVVRSGEVSLGKPIAPHVLLLRRRALLPVETLFDVAHGSPHYNEKDKQGIFYAQSWALVHYLVIERPGSLRAFLDALAGGANSADACRKAVGLEPAILTKQLSSYLRGFTFRYQKAPVKEIPPAQYTEAALGAHEGAFYVGDALVHQNRLDEARPFLDKAIALQPGFAPAYRSIGMGYAMARDNANALRWLASAIERDPRDGLSRLLRVRATVDAAGGAFGPAGAATLREDARLATEALPSSEEAWQFLVYLDSLLDRRDDEALRAVREALRRSPEQHDLWSRLVHLLVVRGETKEAQAVAGRLRARASTAEEKQRSNALLAVVSAALQPAGAGEPPPGLQDLAAGASERPAGGEGARQPVRLHPATAANRKVVRASGIVEKMDCLPDRGLEFTVNAGGRRLRLRAGSPTAVMLYRGDEQVQLEWTCGPLHVPAEAAYVPDEGRADSGTAVSFSIARQGP